MKFDFGKVISLYPLFMGIVEGVQKLKGSKTGAERTAAARDLGKGVVEVVNGVKPGTLNAPASEALVNEGIEITYQIMILQQRLREIDEKIKATVANPSSAADATGFPV